MADIKCEHENCNCVFAQIEETEQEVRIYLKGKHHGETHEQTIVVRKDV